MRVAAFLLLTVLTGCAGRVPDRRAVSWIDFPPGTTEAWHGSAAKRFGPEVFVFDCHGGYRADGTWVACPSGHPFGGNVPMKSVALALKVLYPGRPIVLLPCNSRGVALGVPGVYYAKTSVPAYPGLHMPWRVNDVFDFVCDP